MDSKETLGVSPAILAKRHFNNPNQWCQQSRIDFDSWCDPVNPKTISHKDVKKATAVIKDEITKTPLWHSRFTETLRMKLYYKLEVFHRTGSFSERGALYALKMLNKEQQKIGVITASLGNWAMALSYQGHQLSIPVIVVLPEYTNVRVVEKCIDFGATVILKGNSLDEAKLHAFTLVSETAAIYINGYDHPHVIAGSGTIGLEILEQMPETDAILVPVGGGALIAGIAAAVKHNKPEVLIYGIQPVKCCAFFKAMENEQPYQTTIVRSVAESLAISTAGYNAFHTAQSLIDKMVLVNDDWIARAMLHLTDNEKLIVEGAGAVSLSALFAIPDILPELQEKNVVCVISGGNMDVTTLPKCLERAKALEGRLVKLTVMLPADEMKTQAKVLRIISNVGGNVLQCYIDRGWTTSNEFFTIYDDFDEFCNPDKPKTINQKDVEDAADRLKDHIIKTPCVPSHYQRDYTMNLYYKLETLQKTGSFKERGALNALQLLPLDKKKLGVIIASLGNEAASLCYHASKMNIPTTVVMPSRVPIAKLQACHSLGAKVIVQGSNLMESQRYARVVARDKGLTFINGRDHPHVLAGYGTLALEILDQVPNVDAVLVPVGTGGLAAAIAATIKPLKPNCLVYGVQPESVPTFFKSLENKEPMVLPLQPTLADAIATPSVGVNSFENLRTKLDKMLLVKEDWIARAILHLVEKERYVVEGAGACPLAAIIGNLVPELKIKNVVCLLSGGNIDNITLGRCIDRGMSAEGRLVSFNVGIKNNLTANAQLLRLLSNGGYNVVRQFRNKWWTEDESYYVEVKLVCETKGLEHALELKRIIERAYPCTSSFETEPFNDRRTCPCYVRKSIL